MRIAALAVGLLSMQLAMVSEAAAQTPQQMAVRRNTENTLGSLGINRSGVTMLGMPRLGEDPLDASDDEANAGGAAATASFSTDVAPFEQALSAGGRRTVAAFHSAPGGAGIGVEFWVAGQYTDYDSELNSIGSEGETIILQGGVDVRLGERFIVGVMAAGDWVDAEVGVIDTDASGFLIGPYAVIGLGDNVHLEGLAAGGVAYNEYLMPNMPLTEYQSDRLLLSARLSGDWRQDAWSFRPAARVSYYAETQEQFTDAIGNTFAEDTTSLGQVRVGPEIGYALALGDSGVVQPFAGVEGVWAFQHSDQTMNGTVVSPDDLSASVSLGFDAALGPASLRAAGRVDGLGADDFDAITGELQLRVPFN